MGLKKKEESVTAKRNYRSNREDSTDSDVDFKRGEKKRSRSKSRSREGKRSRERIQLMEPLEPKKMERKRKDQNLGGLLGILEADLRRKSSSPEEKKKGRKEDSESEE